MSTHHFSLWLAAQHNRQDQIGVLARAYDRVPGAPRTRSVEPVREFVRQCAFLPDTAAIFERAVQEFEAQRDPEAVA